MLKKLNYINWLTICLTHSLVDHFYIARINSDYFFLTNIKITFIICFFYILWLNILIFWVIVQIGDEYCFSLIVELLLEPIRILPFTKVPWAPKTIIMVPTHLLITDHTVQLRYFLHDFFAVEMQFLFIDNILTYLWDYLISCIYLHSFEFVK